MGSALAQSGTGAVMAAGTGAGLPCYGTVIKYRQPAAGVMTHLTGSIGGDVGGALTARSHPVMATFTSAKALIMIETDYRYPGQ